MSSEQRASSAVRNLRSMFENKATLDSDSQSPAARGRSPGALGSDKENGGGVLRPTSKVRASFVPVEPVSKMASTTERRGSFGEADADHDLKKTISQQEGKEKDVSENAIESAVGTPSRKPVQGTLPVLDDSPLAQKGDSAAPPANPDKPITAAEEEAGDMKPAELTNEEAVSGGQALPPVEEDLRESTRATDKNPSTNGKPPTISTKTAAKPSSSAVKSPASQPKTPPATKAPTKKASRSSLTAPTAASMARMGAGPEKPSGSKTSPSTAPKKREATKPVSLPSHLTAPTASSRAKHDNASAPAASTSTSKTSTTTSRPKPSSSTRPTPRTSLAPAQRPASQTSHTPATRRSLAPGDTSSFLERMMKPTAASASKTHEKPKSPPRKSKTPAPKSKTNGHVSKSAVDKPPPQSEETEPAAASVKDSQVNGTENPVATKESKVNGAEHSVASPGTQEEPHEPIAAPEATSSEFTTEKADVAGNETPLGANGEPATDTATLQATPMGLAEGESIR